MSSALELGRLIGQALRDQGTLRENIAPDESEGLFNVNFEAILALGVTGTGVAFLYSTNSFILDHPVYGELDSSILLIDGGYAAVEAPYPLSFPIVFGVQTSTVFTF